MQQSALSVEWVPIDQLHLNPANPRHNDEAVPHVVASLERFGWQQPIVAKHTGEVIAGNTRLKAAVDLGMTEVPVVRIEGTDLDAVAYGIADNRTHEFAEWDDGGLAKLLAELRTEDALDGVGFTSDDIDSLFQTLEESAPGAGEVDDPGPGIPPENPISQTGDLWLLGEHRLLCGDSTQIADVERVMAQERASLIATDPPYLVDYTGERPNDSGKDWTDTYHEIDIKDADGFFRALFSNALKVIALNAAIYCWHAHKRQRLIAEIWEELGILDHQQVVWVKPTPVFGRVYWHFQHEPCMMGWVKGSKPEHDGNHEHSSVWTVDWEGKARISSEHPTSKPVELFARPMRKHTSPGDVCFEPFSGSGSQLIAAERERRRCYAIEIEPTFVDVAVRRWQVATGLDAVLEDTGETYAEVAKARS